MDGGSPGSEVAFSDELYEQLRGLAAQMFRREDAGHTLQPTAVVHEAYLRLADRMPEEWNDRSHFFAASARAMRRVLIDAARRRGSEKRGGGAERVTLHEGAAEEEPTLHVGVAELDEALEKLAKHSERYVEIVELRFFGGLSVEEVAHVLGISDRMVRLEWAKARSWLSLYLEDPQF
ncbi:MAG: ECF-type sigma factor [Planctomycetota bacterium]